MIRLKPEPENTFICPNCQSADPVINDIIIPSIHVFADCTCRKCGLGFYQVFPVGHTIDYPLTLVKSGNQPPQDNRTPPWLFDTMLKGLQQIRKNEVVIKKTIFRECKEVVILNTLDFLYGHTLLKLYNALFHIDHHKDVGLIVIIPKMFEWLIPKGCAEAWVIDLKLSELIYGYESIQKFVSAECSRFTKIFLSSAYPVPDFTIIDIERLTGVKPFDLPNFTKLKPTITFVVREDRWWIRSTLDFWVYLACRKLNLSSLGSRILTHRQNQLIKKTIRKVKKELPAADVYVVGLGKTGNFKGYAKDERQIAVTTATEINWCKIYASSHVVVGVHGSNMLLPTAHAAGCVEILPSERYGNLMEDISVKYNDRKQLYFYRFTDQYSGSKSVSDKIVDLILSYEYFNRNMCINIYS